MKKNRVKIKLTSDGIRMHCQCVAIKTDSGLIGKVVSSLDLDILRTNHGYNNVITEYNRNSNEWRVAHDAGQRYINEDTVLGLYFAEIKCNDGDVCAWLLNQPIQQPLFA